MVLTMTLVEIGAARAMDTDELMMYVSSVSSYFCLSKKNCTFYLTRILCHAPSHDVLCVLYVYYHGCKDRCKNTGYAHVILVLQPMLQIYIGIHTPDGDRDWDHGL